MDGSETDDNRTTYQRYLFKSHIGKRKSDLGGGVYRHTPVFSETEIFPIQNSKVIKYHNLTNVA